MKTIKNKKIPPIDRTMSKESVVQLVDWLEELQNLTQAMARKIIDLRTEITQLTMVVKTLDERIEGYAKPKTKH